ncbi:LOC111604862 [Sergentomyia squamirostris]
MTSVDSEIKLDINPVFPLWLNSDFFCSILRNNKHFPGSNDSLCVDAIHMEPASAVGDNYMSTVYRVQIEYRLNEKSEKSETLSLVIKTIPDAGALGEIVEQFNAFPKESEMYSKIIPGLEEIWLRVGHSVQFGPKCWYSSNDPVPVIIMDDLKADDYKMLPRKEGVGLTESKACISKLAKFHAASLIYYDENGPYNDLFNEGIARSGMRNEMTRYYSSMYNGLMEMLEEWPPATPYLPKLRLWKGRVFDAVYELLKSEKDSFNVLNHGDAWTNNLMFRQSVLGKPEVIFIDFQLSSWTSPAVDLLYFIFDACSSEIQLTHLDELLKFYHSELVSSLQELQIPERAPSFEEINNAVHKKGFFGAMMIIETIPTMKHEAELYFDLESVLDPDNEEGKILKRKIFNAEYFKNILKNMLPFLEERGFINVPEF